MDSLMLTEKFWNPTLKLVLDQLQDRFKPGFCIAACSVAGLVEVLGARCQDPDLDSSSIPTLADELMRASEKGHGIAHHPRRGGRTKSDVSAESYFAVRIRGIEGRSSVVLAVGSMSALEYTDDDKAFVMEMSQLLEAPTQMIQYREQLIRQDSELVSKTLIQSQQQVIWLESIIYASEASRWGVQYNNVVEGILDRLLEGLNIPYGAIYFAIDGNWILVNHSGLDDQFLKHAGVIPAGLHEWTQCPDSRADLKPGDVLGSLFEGMNVGSWAVVPLLQSGTIKGGLLLMTPKEDFFTETLLQGLTQLSSALDASMFQADLAYDLAHQAEDLQAVLGSLTDALIEVTADFSIRQANAAAMRLLGVSVGHTNSNSWQSLVPLFDLQTNAPANDRHPLHLSFYDAKAQATSQWRLEVAGKSVFVSTTSSPIIAADHQQVRAVVLVLRDVTEQRARDQQLLSAEKHASISMLAAGVAHEFKNYLSGIIGNASLAEKKSSDPERVAEYMQRIMNIGTRANQTALALLSYVRSSPGEIQRVDLGALVGEVLCLVLERAASQHISIERNFEENVCTDGDSSRIRQIVLNLLTNAMDAMPDGGTLTLTLAALDEKLELLIADTGTGISAEHMNKVFDPFYSTKGVWGGEVGIGGGLGLTTSLNYARELGGDLILESSAGEGTTARVTLPLAIRERIITSDNDDSHNRIAVVVELDPEVRSVIVDELKKLGWSVHACTDAQEVSATLLDASPKLAIIDTLMPGKINFIRSYELIQDRCPSCAIVVTTAESTDYQLDEYVRAAHGRLVKPTTPKAIREFLSRHFGADSVPA